MTSIAVATIASDIASRSTLCTPCDATYGALASDTGTLAVRWEVQTAKDGARNLLIRWSEDGTLETSGKSSKPDGGYGRVLIEKALPIR